jgi:valyl-tRNA synthetase
VQDDAARAILEANSGCVATLVGDCPLCTVLAAGAAAPKGCAVAVVDACTTLYLHVEGALDPTAELAKLQKQVGVAEVALQRMCARMAMPAYQGNTPEAIRTKDEEKRAELEAELSKLGAMVAQLQVDAAP